MRTFNLAVAVLLAFAGGCTQWTDLKDLQRRGADIAAAGAEASNDTTETDVTVEANSDGNVTARREYGTGIQWTAWQEIQLAGVRGKVTMTFRGKGKGQAPVVKSQTERTLEAGVGAVNALRQRPNPSRPDTSGRPDEEGPAASQPATPTP